MQPEQYELMRRQEEAHWWYRGNRSVLLRLVARHAGAGPQRWLDAGCGTGKNLQSLPQAKDPCGIDFDAQALRFCRGRGLARLARASVTALPFAEGSFDLLTCFEVLNSKSIDDWRAALPGFLRVLRPGGLAILREPAFPFLYGSHDVVVHTARRFRRAEFRAALVAAGFEVLRCSYQNLVTFFPALVIRSTQRWRGLERIDNRADFGHGGVLARLLGGLLAASIAAEGPWLRFANLPLGSSLLSVARRPAT